MKDKLLTVLFALLGLTLLSWACIALAHFSPKMLGGTLLLLAFVKVYLIVLNYMEVSAAGPLVRIGFNAWVWLVGAMTLGMYLR